MELTCPKCQGAMRSYERSGVVVDQCTECRGVFLDRGELEKLMDAEAAFNAAPAAVAGGPVPSGERQGAAVPPWGSEDRPAPRRPDEDRYRDADRYRDGDKYRDGDRDRYRDGDRDRYRDGDKYRDGDRDRYRDGDKVYGYGSQRPQKKKKSFIEELFD